MRKYLIGKTPRNALFSTFQVMGWADVFSRNPIGEVTFDTERLPELNMDLTHFRAYDPTLGRWWQVDPLASEMSSWTPYNYGFNNPIRFNDPLGDAPSAMMRIGNTDDSMGQDWSKEWFGNQQAMFSNGGGGGIQKYLPSSPPTAKEGEKKEEKVNNDNTNGVQNDVDNNLTDNVGLAGTVGAPVGGGAKGILDNRGTYLPKGQIYKMNMDITVKTPLLNVNTTSKALNYVRVGGKVLGVAGVAATGVQVYGDWSNGRYYSAGTRATVFGVAAGAAFIPVVGWGVAAGIGVADYVWGDQFYNYVENSLR